MSYSCCPPATIHLRLAAPKIHDAAMTTRTIIIVCTFALIAVGILSENIAALLIAIVGSILIWQAHIIELKLNKLLDHAGIVITKADFED
ncbi:MAG: hypothetical protein BGO65_01565 [Afipia sp. 64-13]|nr:MAG: hypothetical protein BGO65_01565 [Afipia sp. 64-13]